MRALSVVAASAVILSACVHWHGGDEAVDASGLGAGEQPEPAAPVDDSVAKRWIWAGAAEDHEDVWFHRSFEVVGTVRSASLWGACDNAMQVYLNGNSVALSDQWQQPIEVDVSAELRSGPNQLAVWARNDSGPAGLVLALRFEDQRGPRQLVTDGEWRLSNQDPGPDWTQLVSVPNWPRATDLGPYGSDPWGELGQAQRPTESEALEAEAIRCPQGFEVERLYSVPRARQGSWVSLCADDRGRLYASDQHGGLFRVSLAGGVRVEEVPIEVGEAHGLLWAFDSLYVVVSDAGTYESGLYRARDADGDDLLDEVEQLARFEGNGEHGPHAVVLGPDGDSLYLIAGNHVDLPEITSSRVPELWDEDLLLPRMEDPNGHAAGKRAPGGWIVKTDREATAFELIAVGFRNSYDLAFDTNGELFSFDADMEWDTGLPWYRPTRILHVTSGAEFGWRSGSGKWPTYYPDSLPEVVDIGLTSPTGVVMGSAAAFPERWRRMLYAADWAYGVIYAVQLEEAGASYRGRAQPFVSGTPLPVTDLAIGTDGALYFTTGGRRAQSGLYRVRWIGGEGTEPAEPVSDSIAAEARARRHELEALHGDGHPDAVQAVWSALSDPDRHLRFAARTALESVAPELWRERALAETQRRASVEAMLGLVRCDEALSAAEVMRSLDAWAWEDFEREELLAALRVFGLALMRVDGVVQEAVELDHRLLALLPTLDDACDRELVRLLATRQLEGLIPKALDLLESAATQEAAIQHAYSLSSVRVGWDDSRRARFLAWFDSGTEAFEGGVSFRLYLDEMRRRATDAMGVSLTVEAASSAGEYGPKPDDPKLAFVRDYDIDDLAPALERLASGRDFELGKSLYRRTTCLQCHRIAGDGGGTGPDLTGTAGRYSALDLLGSLLEPSAAVSDQYRDTEVWTTDGHVAVGRILSEQDGTVVLRESSGNQVEINLAEVELQRPHPLSRMPEGLLDVLTEDEVLDLMAYVLAGGDPEHPAFE